MMRNSPLPKKAAASMSAKKATAAVGRWTRKDPRDQVHDPGQQVHPETAPAAPQEGVNDLHGASDHQEDAHHNHRGQRGKEGRTHGHQAHHDEQGPRTRIQKPLLRRHAISVLRTFAESA
jgi:hypothetical protein